MKDIDKNYNDRIKHYAFWYGFWVNMAMWFLLVSIISAIIYFRLP